MRVFLCTKIDSRHCAIAATATSQGVNMRCILNDVIFPSGTWALEELSGVLGVPQELLRRKLALWQQHGVLHEESPGRYGVLEKASSRERPDRGIMLLDSDEEGDSNTTTQSEQREEKLQVGEVNAYIRCTTEDLVKYSTLYNRAAVLSGCN